jgi:ABC-type protease/lipase transport system fused ATPase/permease subunit
MSRQSAKRFGGKGKLQQIGLARFLFGKPELVCREAR